MPMRIFVSAGEPSGDLHGANLVRALRRAQPDARIEGFGGERMAQAGCDLVYPLCRLAVMGLFPVLAHLPKFLGVLSKADRWFRHHRPDALVLIDYPGLHWWLARRARFHKIPVFYFVPPQIWAWASWRVNKMRKWVDHVLCSLPFEEPWYRERGVNAEYIGHPYFDELHHQRLEAEFMANQRARGGRIIGLLPGSRSQEVEMNGVTMVQAARRLAHQLPDARFLFACYKPKHQERIRQLLRGNEHLPIEVHVGRTPEIIQLSEACVAVSGSVGLELLWACKPTVVVYRGSRLLAAVAKRLVKCKYASLVNLLADRELYPELLTTECPAEAVAEQVHHWLTHPFEAMRLGAELRALRDRVAQPGACERAARFVLSLAGHSEDRLRSAA
jgi:lipid-A-disaccharide synthase